MVDTPDVTTVGTRENLGQKKKAVIVAVTHAKDSSNVLEHGIVGHKTAT